MDIKVIFWIAVTIVIFLIIIAFWSEKDMFFRKKKEVREVKGEVEKVEHSKVKQLIKNIQFVIDFLEEFCESSELNSNTCRLLSDFLGEKINSVTDYRLSINASEKLIDAQFLFRPGIFKRSCVYTLKNTINCLENELNK